MSDLMTGDLAPLLEGVRAGDEQAAAALVTRYGPMLRRVFRVTGRIRWLQSQRDSQDLVQSIFMQVIRDLRTGNGEFPDEARFEAYLRTVGRHQLCDQIRRGRAAKRGGPRTLDDGAESLSSLAAPGPSPSRLAELREAVAGVEACVPQADLALLQARMAGQPWEEIASSRGYSREAVRKRVERIRARIRATLAASGSRIAGVDR